MNTQRASHGDRSKQAWDACEMVLRDTVNDFCSSMARMNTANPEQTPQIMEVDNMGGSDSNDSYEDARREKASKPERLL